MVQFDLETSVVARVCWMGNVDNGGDDFTDYYDSKDGRYLTFVIGNITGAASTDIVTITLQDSADAAAFTDVAGAPVITLDPISDWQWTVGGQTGHTKTHAYRVDLNRTRRYVRLALLNDDASNINMVVSGFQFQSGQSIQNLGLASSTQIIKGLQ